MAAEQELDVLRVMENPGVYPGLVARDPSSLALRVWIYHSFEPYRSWSVHRVEDGGDCAVRRIVWDQRVKIALAGPETYGAEAPITAGLLNQLTEELTTIGIPAHCPTNALVLDGSEYGFDIRGSLTSARYSWWLEPPKPWLPLAQWHARVVERLEACLPASTLRYASKAL